MYKIFSNKDEISFYQMFTLTNTDIARNSDGKLFIDYCKISNLRKYSFANRVK